jgi:hypothetical protein
VNNQTNEAALSRIVRVEKFYSKFDGKIVVSTNYRDYNLVLDIINVYLKELASNSEMLTTNESVHVVPITYDITGIL